MPTDNLVYTTTIQGLGALTADFLAHPLYTTWTIQQAHFYYPKPMTFRDICKTHGFADFYAGFSPQAIAALPGTFLYLEGRKQTLALFGENNVGYFMQGPISVTAGMLVWSPAMRLTVSQQASNNSSGHFNQLSLTAKCRYIINNEGIKGLYRGALGATTSFAISDALGSWLQAQLLNYYPDNKQKKVAPQITSTALAFGFAAFMTSPIELITSHLRLHETNPTQFPNKKFTKEMKRIYCKKGYRGFFRSTHTWVAYQTAWHLIIPFVNLMD